MIHPLRDFIVVAKEVEEEKTPSGLIIKPATVDNKIVKAKVLAVGSGRLTVSGSIVPLEVKVGDIVLFNKNFATEVSEGTDNVMVLREDQLLCIVR